MLAIESEIFQDNTPLRHRMREPIFSFHEIRWALAFARATELMVGLRSRDVPPPLACPFAGFAIFARDPLQSPALHYPLRALRSLREILSGLAALPFAGSATWREIFSIGLQRKPHRLAQNGDLTRREQALEDFMKAWVAEARADVLPAIGFEQRSADLDLLLRTELALAGA